MPQSRARRVSSPDLPTALISRAPVAPAMAGWLPLLFFVFSFFGAAAAAPVDVYVFWRQGCPHCERELAFLARLESADSGVRVLRLEVWGAQDASPLLERTAALFRAERVAVPFTIVGDRAFIGYQDDASTGSRIAARIAECAAEGCIDSMKALISGAAPPTAPAAPLLSPPAVPVVRLPLFGEIATRELSLPVLTVVLAAVDGFNPCAMWILVFLIGMLAGVEDRLRLRVLGAAFIGASAAVYFAFMAAWLNALLLFGAVAWVRAAVGMVALAGGAYYLREFARNRGAVCEVTAPAGRRRVLERLKSLALERNFLPAVAGIVALAVAVNLVELLCSAGIPAVYTQVLALSGLPAWQYYAYLLLYVAVFMLDDIVVFFAAMKTLEVTGMGTRYLRFSQVVGGLTLLVLGMLLLFKPAWLTFV